MKCRVSQQCGSCQYIDMDYQQQLQKKYNYYQDLYRDFHVSVHSIHGMNNPYAYRNKVIVAFNQKYEYGLYEEESHKIVPIKKCLLHDEETHYILDKLQCLFKKYRISIYDNKRRKGFLRHVLIRRAIQTNQTLVVLVVSDSIFKGSKNFSQELIKFCPSVKSIVLNINKRQTSIVLSQQEKVLYGKGFIVDELCGLTFKISAQSFYQINHEQCTKLYQKVIQLLDVKDGDVVLDTYCGIGTITLSVAKYVKKVYGVEIVDAAIADAKNNADLNSINNVEFTCADAGKYMIELVNDNQHFDVVFVDPPRKGCSSEFLDYLVAAAPKKIVYISCDVATQARDIKFLQEFGYTADICQPVDMFPQTTHVETVVLMSRKEK